MQCEDVVGAHLARTSSEESARQRLLGDFLLNSLSSTELFDTRFVAPCNAQAVTVGESDSELRLAVTTRLHLGQRCLLRRQDDCSEVIVDGLVTRVMLVRDGCIATLKVIEQHEAR